jgi:hypothetical protein
MHLAGADRKIDALEDLAAVGKPRMQIDDFKQSVALIYTHEP